MDPVADMLTIIKNGYMAKKPEVFVTYSKFKLAIASILEKEEFIGKVEKQDAKIKISLLYQNQKPKVTQIKRISKLGLRIYTRSKNIKNIKGGKGLVIVSTSQGVMNAKEAKSKNLGGEIICQLW
ncbi:30S ribosomal protein S8 [Candidatus Curtissbacteria bacterium]|nr:30S ribosomal protein S8 [Candidatus Curtissbacteria bacterium]